ncbi:MAG TPA: hypothetical protein VFM21_09900 [Terriglobia bacterium]|nr:hypothetical protein [Terriglobia bacterium]
MTLALKVECYSGFKADERPLRFTVQAVRRGVSADPEIPPAPPPCNCEVKEVLDQWYGPGYQCFKVLADDGNLYILRHDQPEDTWTLDSFRSGTDASA